MKILDELISLVNNNKINLFCFYYPVVSPQVELKWSGMYQAHDLNEYFSPEAVSFVQIGSTLLEFIRTKENIKVNEFGNHDQVIKEIELFLVKIVEFINEQVEDYSSIWLLGLEFNKDSEQNGAWVGTIEGDIYLDMQISIQSSNLAEVCKGIIQALIDRGYII